MGKKKQKTSRREWWDKLSAEQKFEAYNRECNMFNFSRGTINTLVDHLLGTDWYACDTGNLYNVDPIIISTIKANYKGVGKNINADNNTQNIFIYIYNKIKGMF